MTRESTTIKFSNVSEDLVQEAATKYGNMFSRFDEATTFVAASYDEDSTLYLDVSWVHLAPVYIHEGPLLTDQNGVVAYYGALGEGKVIANAVNVYGIIQREYTSFPEWFLAMGVKNAEIVEPVVDEEE